ncbi:MAG: shikimate kinase [Aestuariibaculum sp.]
MIVILIGYMASGKSTIGKILAKKLNCEFLDLDNYIESQENMVISDIFKSKGEIYFRKAETKYLKKVLNTKSKLVLSLGGGVPCYNNNMQLILTAKNAVSVYLKASISTLANRLKNESANRPIIAHIDNEEQLSEFIGKHLFERSPFYVQANKTIVVDKKIETEIIEEIVAGLF